MNTSSDKEQLIAAVREKVDANRRKVLRNNLFMIFAIVVAIAGMSASFWYYNRLETTQRIVENQKDSLEKLTVKLDSMRNRLAAQKDSSDLLLQKIDSSGAAKNIPGFEKAVAVITSSRDTARSEAHRGYALLKAYNFREAMLAFKQSEAAYNGYHDSYEVYYLLWKHKNELDDPDVQKQLMQQIISNYNSFRLLTKADIK